jgi:hypothetical protein
MPRNDSLFDWMLITFGCGLGRPNTFGLSVNIPTV